MNDTLDHSNPSTTTQPHLLIVDDEPEVANSLHRQFRRNYTVHTATNVPDALKILAEWPVQVVISDQRMPEVTGVEFFTRIKDEYPDTIRVLLTGYADIDAVISAINDGSIFRYIRKPWDRTELESVVREAFERQKLTTENRRLLSELHVSEQRYRDLFEASPVALWELDWKDAKRCLSERQPTADQDIATCLAKVRVTNYNRATAQLLETDDDQDSTPEILNLLNTDMREFFKEFMLAKLNGKKDYQHEVTISTQQKHQTPVLVHGSILTGHEDTGAKVIIALTDISEQKQVEDALKTMLDRESELSKLRLRVIDTVSHEFRTPLAIIRSSSDILAKYSDRLSNEEREKKRNRIDDAIDGIIGLLTDAIAYSEGSAGDIRLVPAALDLINLCHSAIAQIRSPKLQSSQIQFSHEGDCDGVSLDRYVFETVVGHLLQNAVKFSPTGGLVELHVACDQKSVTVTVADEGIGIPPAEQAQVFAAFSRASNSGTIPGIGLGLAITKQLVEIHGGTISCASREEVGMAFTVRLPFLDDQDR